MHYHLKHHVLLGKIMTIESPCVQKCKLSPKDHNGGERYCTACTRTITQIVNWSKLNESERSNIMDNITKSRLDVILGNGATTIPNTLSKWV